MEESLQKFKYLYLEKKFLFDCVLLSILFFVNCFTFVGAYFAFTLMFVLVLTSDLKKGISYVFFGIGFCYMTHPSSIILLMVCLLTYVAKIVYIKFFVEHNKLSKSMVIMLSVLLLYLIFPFKNIYNGDLFVKILAIYAIFILVFLCLNFPQEFRLKYNISVITYSLVIASLFSILGIWIPYLKENFALVFMGEDHFRFCALFYNPNVLGMICEMCLSVLAYYILSKNHSNKEIVSFIILSVLGFLTFSKAFLLIYCVILAIMFFWNARKFSKRGWLTLGVFAIVCVIALILFFDVALSYIGRFMKLDTTGMNLKQFLNILTTSRYDLWVDYIRYLIDNPLVIFFGRGLGAPIVSVNSPHNMYLSMIYQMGIIGLALYIAAFIVMIKKAPKIEGVKINKAIIIPIVVFALLCMEEDLIFFIY